MVLYGSRRVLFGVERRILLLRGICFLGLVKVYLCINLYIGRYKVGGFSIVYGRGFFGYLGLLVVEFKL